TRQVRQQKVLLRKLREAAAILAFSEATRDDLVSFGIECERVVVAPLGLHPLSDPEPLPELSPGSYLLTVGETAVRKGYRVLLEALALLEPDLGLVMVGPSGADEHRLVRLVAQLGLGRRVQRLGAV